MATISAVFGSSLFIYPLILSLITGLLYLVDINIVESWHFLAQKLEVSFIVICLLETMPLSFLFVYYTCTKEKRYKPIYEKVLISKDSQLLKTFKGIFICISSLFFSFICMVLFL